MKCAFEKTERLDPRGRYVHRCANCGREVGSKYENPAAITAVCSADPEKPGIVRRAMNFARAESDSQPPAPKEGPGTELKKLLAELGITGVQGCGCERKAAAMNRWGVVGCKERFAEIRQWLVEARGKATWTDMLRAAAAVVAGGLLIDPLNIEESLVRISIARAERIPHDPQ